VDFRTLMILHSVQLHVCLVRFIKATSLPGCETGVIRALFLAPSLRFINPRQGGICIVCCRHHDWRGDAIAPPAVHEKIRKSERFTVAP